MIKKQLIVITGKSGSGKSLFSEILAEKLDAEILHLDKISHLSLKDENIKKELTNKFSTSILDDFGDINRKALGEIVFQNEQSLKFLNNLSQAFMEDFIDKKIISTEKHFVILEYALLPKMKYMNQSNFKILLVADEAIRIERVLKRDNISMEYLLKREKSSIDYNPQNFDEIIENNANLQQKLTEIAENLAKKIQTPII